MNDIIFALTNDTVWTIPNNRLQGYNILTKEIKEVIDAPFLRKIVGYDDILLGLGDDDNCWFMDCESCSMEILISDCLDIEIRNASLYVLLQNGTLCCQFCHSLRYERKLRNVENFCDDESKIVRLEKFCRYIFAINNEGVYRVVNKMGIETKDALSKDEAEKIKIPLWEDILYFQDEHLISPLEGFKEINILNEYIGKIKSINMIKSKKPTTKGNRIVKCNPSMDLLIVDHYGRVSLKTNIIVRDKLSLLSETHNINVEPIHSIQIHGDLTIMVGETGNIYRMVDNAVIDLEISARVISIAKKSARTSQV